MSNSPRMETTSAIGGSREPPIANHSTFLDSLPHMQESDRDQLSVGAKVDTYRSAAIVLVDATRREYLHEVGQRYQELEQALKELFLCGPAGARALLRLLVDPDDAVRLWAASHCKKAFPKECEHVLEGLAMHGETFVRISASLLLEPEQAHDVKRVR
jgi:hypothetical protein